MQWARIIRAASTTVALLLAALAAAAADGKNTPTGIAVWDTGKMSANALTATELAKKEGWTLLPPGKTDTAFQGDAVLTNGRVLAVLRRKSGTAEVYALGPGGAVYRLGLRPTGEPTSLKVAAVNPVENSKTAASLQVSYAGPMGSKIVAKFRVKRGEVAISTEPGAGATRLHVTCPSQFVVLPDFFADDIVIDPRKLRLSPVEVPSENFLLHLTGPGDALAVSVFENQKQDVKLVLSGEGEKRAVTGSVIAFEGKKVWTALLEGPQIWHTSDLKPADAGKTVPLGWKMPFPAQWRVDFSRLDGVIDSWEMLLAGKDGGYVKPYWMGSGSERLDASRRRWNTVLGTFAYPCWSDPMGQGYVQPLKKKGVLELEGRVVVYPINRVKETPLDAYTVVDIMRNTLGVGPCEHILDVEGQKSQFQGRATCSVRDTLTPIYANKQQKRQRAKVDKTLDEGLAFVKHIRGRINHYVEFGHKMRAYLAEQKKAQPEQAAFIAEMDKICQMLDARYAARKEEIKTPDYVAQMNADFRKNVLDYDGADALDRCKKYAKALVVIGGNQDELAGECRYVVKHLRQVAGIRMAQDPKVASIAAEIRAKTQEALRNPAHHEGARH